MKHAITLILCFLLVAALSGCSREEYKQGGLGVDSVWGKKINAMLSELRAQGINKIDDILAAQANPGLNADELSRVRNSVTRLIEAPSAKLISVDSFGDQAIRAGFEITISKDGKEVPTQVYMLLTNMDNKLYWLGPN
ncbi:MAG: hypothetical protein K8S99_03105 [Planctomycetes bacterium]|nr:hypothetical protein [Planctomycetota bacterium]